MVRRRFVGIKQKRCAYCGRCFYGKIEETGTLCTGECAEKYRLKVPKVFNLNPKPVIPAFSRWKPKKKNVHEQRRELNQSLGIGKKARRKQKVKVLQREVARLLEENAALKKGVAPKKEPVKSFYDSREWLELKYRVIKTYGRKCMACYATDKQIHVDHIIPRIKRPDLELEFSNLQVLCRDCNLGKSWKDQTDFRPKV